MAWRIQFLVLSILSLVVINYLPIGNEVVAFLLSGFGVVTILRLSSYYRFHNLIDKSLEIEIDEVSPGGEKVYSGQYQKPKKKEEPKTRSVGGR